MLRVVLRGIWSHKRRLIGTCSAVIIGVAFLAGTLVLSDTMRASFDTIFAAANSGTDAVIQGSESIGQGSTAQSSLVPDSLVPQVQQLPTVAEVAPVIQGIGQIIGANGKPVGGEGPPTLAGNWVNASGLNPYQLTQGVAPASDGQIVINESAATAGKLKIGDKTTLRFPDPVPVTIVGLVKFGSSDSLAGTTFAGMTLADAQKYLGYPGKVTSIAVKAKSGVTQTALVDSIKPLLPAGTEALTGAQVTQNLTDQINDGFLGFFTTFLLVFAVIAVIVAAFSIYNTFSVIVAQRMRESALLRAIGASRSQIMWSLAVEALIIGLIASTVGIGAGVLLALGLKALLDNSGSGLPPGGLVVTGTAVIVSLLVGVLVTLAASLLPAVRASRVPPLAALRDVAVDRSGTSRVRAWLGGGIGVVGLLVMLSIVVSSGQFVLQRVAAGAVLTFVGFMVFAPVAALPVGAAIGAPIRWTRGVSGAMAGRNATRNPKRTASTAAALVVGVTIVGLFTIFASSIKSSIETSVAGSFKGELVMSNSNFAGVGFSPRMVTQIGALPQVSAAASMSRGVVLTGKKQLNVTVADPRKLGVVLALPTAGAALADLGPDQLAASADEAILNGWSIGGPVTVAFADGSVERLTLGATYTAADLVGAAVIPEALYNKHVKQVAIDSILIALASGVSVSDGQAAVQAVADQYGAGSVQTREEFIKSVAGQIDSLLNVVYALLGLAILIALMGIANTLSLSIHERTRELGLLRAVGQTRGQLRSMVRWESVIIALFGTICGLLLGVVLGWALMKAVAAEEAVAVFSLPVGQLLLVGVVGGVAGVLAGLRPAWRASKLNVLAAIGAD
ncbi:MAG: FtsX-like permease family protein [Actinomycetes bacterium]